VRVRQQPVAHVREGFDEVEAVDDEGAEGVVQALHLGILRGHAARGGGELRGGALPRGVELFARASASATTAVSMRRSAASMRRR